MEFRIADVLRGHARKQPDAPAITGEGLTLTYAELDAMSNQLAQGLLAARVAAGDRVCYIGKNTTEFFITLFAAAKIGAVLAPVNWRLTHGEIITIVADCQASAVVLDQESGPLRDALEVVCPRVEETGSRFAAWLAGHAPDDPGYRGSGSDVVLQLFTSGTTGAAKGVQLTEDNMSTAARLAKRWEMSAESVCLVAMPVFHVGGSHLAMIGLSAGAHCRLLRDVVPAELVATLSGDHVTHTFVVPSVLKACCEVPGAADGDYSALHTVSYGASPITTETLRRIEETFHAPLVQLYGMTETTGAITELPSADHDIDGPRAHLLRSAGRPYEWAELRISDPATGAELPAGEVGEVWLRSPQNTPGYFRRSAETEELYAPDGWLRSGDAGYLDEDGYLFLTDRIKDMIVTGGENVYPVEIEEVMSQHPGVADVAVIGVPDEKWGESVKAIVVTRPGADAGEQELLDFARERLAGFKRPRTIDFADDLPRNPSGKLLKKELRRRYWAATERMIG